MTEQIEVRDGKKVYCIITSRLDDTDIKARKLCHFKRDGTVTHIIDKKGNIIMQFGCAIREDTNFAHIDGYQYVACYNTRKSMWRYIYRRCVNKEMGLEYNIQCGNNISDNKVRLKEVRGLSKQAVKKLRSL